MKEITIDGVVYTPKSTKLKKDKLTYCIVRTYSAGVFAGYVDTNKKGKELTIYDSRRLWYWSGASSLSQLAKEGVKNPSDCKFPCKIEETILKEVVEIIPATLACQKSIDGVSIWKQ